MERKAMHNKFLKNKEYAATVTELMAQNTQLSSCRDKCSSLWDILKKWLIWHNSK